jgi:Ni/Fe-hydrogenase subunit HybB-like protein
MVSSAGPASSAPQSTFRFFLQELKPKGKLLTPFNIISLPVILLGLVLTIIRFTQGLGSVTNLNQQFPWGFWIGFDVVCGVAFAAGAYVITFVVYVMNAEKYRPIVRITVLNGFLAYVFYAGALTLDLGRPWKIVNPIIGNSYGYSSVLFLVAWHFMLYMIAALIEFAPAIAEWLGMRRVRRVLNAMTVGAVIFGITLSMLHQSGMGALFLMAKSKIHPLWYSEFIPILFFVSSIFAGLSMIIVEGTISHRVFKKLMDAEHREGTDEIVIGLARGAAIAMFVYYFFKTTLFIHDEQWRMMGDFWGHWYLLEVIGLVLVPCFMFAYGARHRDLSTIRTAAIMTLAGVALNRLNISIIAFNWFVPDHYYPSWQEIAITLMIVFAEIWAIRWVVLRMPVLRKAPGFE